jgi:hypothetical protein
MSGHFTEDVQALHHEDYYHYQSIFIKRLQSEYIGWHISACVGSGDPSVKDNRPKRRRRRFYFALHEGLRAICKLKLQRF